jgi:hypothetical protein
MACWGTVQAAGTPRGIPEALTTAFPSQSSSADGHRGWVVDGRVPRGKSIRIFLYSFTGEGEDEKGRGL